MNCVMWQMNTTQLEFRSVQSFSAAKVTRKTNDQSAIDRNAEKSENKWRSTVSNYRSLLNAFLFREKIPLESNCNPICSVAFKAISKSTCL